MQHTKALSDNFFFCSTLEARHGGLLWKAGNFLPHSNRWVIAALRQYLKEKCHSKLWRELRGIGCDTVNLRSVKVAQHAVKVNEPWVYEQKKNFNTNHEIALLAACTTADLWCTGSPTPGQKKLNIKNPNWKQSKFFSFLFLQFCNRTNRLKTILSDAAETKAEWNWKLNMRGVACTISKKNKHTRK